MYFWIFISFLTLFLLVKGRSIINFYRQIKIIYERFVFLSDKVATFQNIFPGNFNLSPLEEEKSLSKLHFDPSLCLAWIEFENEGKIYKTYFPYSYLASEGIKVMLVFQEGKIEITHCPKLAYGFSASDFGAEKIILEKDSKIIKELNKNERLLFYEEE